MHLRLATLADLPTLLRWDEQPHVATSGGDDDVFDWAAEIPRDVDWREILIGEIAAGRAARPVGVVMSIDPAREETRYWGAIEPGLRALDIWIGDAADLGRGYGTQMMRRVLERCFADPSVAAVLVDPLEANVRAHRFYERLGFRRVERRRFGDDDCFVTRIERAQALRPGQQARKAAVPAYRNIDDARARIGSFIDEVYNRQRLHSALACMTPAEFEAALTPAGTLAPRDLFTGSRTCPSFTVSP